MNEEKKLILEALEHYSWWLDSMYRTTGQHAETVQGKQEAIGRLISKIASGDSSETAILQLMIERMKKWDAVAGLRR